MKRIAVILGGMIAFGLLFIAANNVTGMISQTLGASRAIDNALTIVGMALVVLGTAVFVRAIWRRGRKTEIGDGDAEADLPAGDFVSIAEGRRNRDVVLPSGNRCILVSRLLPKDAIDTFMARCGFVEYHISSKEGFITATASSRHGGIDVVAVPYRQIEPAILQGAAVFQVYSTGTARRENDVHFADQIGFFAPVSSEMGELALRATGPLWSDGKSVELTRVEVRV